MLNFHIRKVTLKSDDIRYRIVITRSGKAVKTKTIRRKPDVRTIETGWFSKLLFFKQDDFLVLT